MMTPNKFDLTLLVSNYGAVSSKSSENCDRRRVDRQTDVTDVGEFIICPMLCYSNGTDKNSAQINVSRG